MSRCFVIFVCTLLVSGAVAQAQEARSDLYRCEGCEAVFDVDHQSLTPEAAIASDTEPGERLHLTGTVYQMDKVTPADGVVLYIYHTNSEGFYAGSDGLSAAGDRHGRLRGWVRTGADGNYAVSTIRPAPYPGLSEPAHIHLTVLEQGRQPYWIDSVVFTDDPLVSARYRQRASGRGGSGIVTPQRNADGGWLVSRDIILERHPE